MGKELRLLLIAGMTAVFLTPIVAAQPVDLEMWVTATVTEAGPPPFDWEVYKTVRDKLGINLKLVFLPSTTTDQDTKINTAAAANRLPDVFYANRNPWMKLVRSGLVSPVDDIWTKIPSRVAKYYSDPEAVKLITYNGKKYGFPDPGAGFAPVVEGLVIRKDWLDKLKLPVPKTTEDLLAVAKAFTERDPDGNGKNDTYGFGAFVEQVDLMDSGLGRRFYPVTGAFGVPILWDVSSAKNFSLAIRKPEYLEALRYVKRMSEAKAVIPDWPTLKKDDFRLLWKQGRFGIMYEQFAALLNPSNYAPFDKNFPNGEWIGIPPIKGPKGLAAGSVAIQSVRIHAVSKRASSNPQKMAAIARLLEWMSSDEGYYLLGYGKKGVNYNLDASGTVNFSGLDPKKVTMAAEVANMTQIRHLVYTNDDRELLIRYPAWKRQNGTFIEPLKMLRYFNSQPYFNATPASFINPPANAADMQRYLNEHIQRFVLGLEPLDDANWQAFVKGFDALGADRWEKDAKAYLQSIGQLR